MKKIFLFLLIMSVNRVAFSQNTEEYVEVIVSDTIQAEPEEIIYTIYTREVRDVREVTEKPLGKTINIQKPVTKEETVEEKLRNIIKTMMIDTLKTTRHTLENEIYNDSYKNIFTLRFVSKQDLDSFLIAIQGIRSITGFISGKKTSKVFLLEKMLTDRILQKAATSAGLIATASGRILGKIIQVKEENPDESRGGGWTVYPPLSALAQADYSNSSAKIIIAKKLVVRYSW